MVGTAVPSRSIEPLPGFAPQDGQSPWVLLSTLWRGRKLIAISAVLLAILVGGVLLLTPREYKASAAFVPQEPNAAPAGLGAIAAQFGISAPRAMTTSPQFYADLLQSREVLRDVLLTTYSAPPDVPSQTLLQYLKVKGSTPGETMTRGIKKVRDLMDVKVNRQTGVVSFEFMARNAVVSQQVVERLLALLSEYNMKRRQSQGRAEREFTEQRLSDARRELANAEAALAEFNSRNRRFADFSSLTGEAAKLQRQVTINQQLYISLSQNYEAAKIEEVRNTPVITLIERPQGFVEPMARGTIKKTALAFLVGAFFAAMFLLAQDFVRRMRARGQRDFMELLDLVTESLPRAARQRT